MYESRSLKAIPRRRFVRRLSVRFAGSLALVAGLLHILLAFSFDFVEMIAWILEPTVFGDVIEPTTERE